MKHKNIIVYEKKLPYFQMEGIFSLALLAALAIAAASATMGNNEHHLEKRTPLVPTGLGAASLAAIPFLAGGGEKPGDISKAPPQVAAMLQMGRL